MNWTWTTIRSEIARALRLRSLVVWFRTRGPVPEPPVVGVDFAYASPSAVAYYDKAMRTVEIIHDETTDSIIVIDPSEEVIHEGADETGEWAEELETISKGHRPLTAEAKRAITTDTGEFDVTALFGEPAPAPAWVEDELGLWNPDTADWLAPAIFREVSADALKAGALTVPISEVEFVDAVMRRVLEPAR